MLELELQPHVGIGPAKLGAIRSDIRSALEQVGLSLDTSSDRQDYFDGIQVEYTDEKCSFIGASWSQRYIVKFAGLNVFNVSSEELFATLSTCDGSGEHAYNTYDYLFPNQLVTLWEADQQYDRLGGESRVIWAQIGIGNEVYREAVQRIKGGA